MIKSIIFDVDGTLYDETQAKIKAEILTAEFIRDKTGKTLESVFQVFRQTKASIMKANKGRPEGIDRLKWYEETLRILEVETDLAMPARDLYWHTVLENIEPYADLMAILPRLSQNFNLYVLTDELYAVQSAKLEKLGLTSYFKEIVASDHVGETKPSPLMFGTILDRVGDTPENVLMIGDNPKADIAGGKLAGMRTAWLRRGKYSYYKFHDYDQPDIVLEHYMALESKLKIWTENI